MPRVPTVEERRAEAERWVEEFDNAGRTHVKVAMTKDNQILIDVMFEKGWENAGTMAIEVGEFAGTKIQILSRH